ncbi:farnesyl-diphosphate synthase [Marinobacter nauticus]|jgi:geranylgeranyl diphosphate synthase type II|uniref:Farnesyl-diphosphate synthase n=1 Tax=Marinobacter nauticus TaxID=2743 RepID=A0A368XNF9_MARNT|nr:MULTISPECIES: farnesyl diphosphate synthase [Marinobacter]MEC9038234.1 farnesyl diphosphate synthase [Pseudomonadota bacterium]ERS84972.1 farnesyl-diphosphate synthase [Marinobacter sp. EVN1]MCW9010234.1 (2E,6E)-farnesyl diphosphate synthase [Marinobacter sp.]RCW69089.1 farnesyl-diphosphate synthase [Marinobacter nauticus]CCG94292.1 geranyltranstransferase [Marinobacter nauticus ATCC 49840]|tara:strand:- start:143 stop:1039 length:897 start_codon:yes stop_codon:yes gene_type:complete
MDHRIRQAEAYLDQCRQQVDRELDRCLARHATSERLQETMRYSVLGGGKRVRPALCMAAARAMGSDESTALAPACALELIHAYSLVHDDLPAMDDDDLRRGRPTAHIAFDEASAILAGDALQTLAFALLSDAPALSDRQRVTMISELARASGHQGMVGGQAIDLESVGRQLSVAQLEAMHRHKTGALIEASVRLGALTSETVTECQLSNLTDYASALGLAFQVQDDLLDIEGDTEVIGKRQGSDAARAKPTYPALLGIEGARQHLARLLDEALSALESFDSEADTLRAMADYVVARSH